MQLIELSGDAAQMGEQHGTLLRKASRLSPPDPNPPRFARECEKRMQQHAPHMLEELHALGKSAGWRFDALLTLSLTAPFIMTTNPGSCLHGGGCPAGAHGRRPHDAGLGRNYDYFHDVSKEGAAIYRTYPQEGNAHLGCCDIWVGREDGLNDARFICGNGSHFPALAAAGARFLVHRTHGSGALRNRGGRGGADPLAAPCRSRTYLLADPTGKAAVLEPGPAGVEVRYPEDGL